MAKLGKRALVLPLGAFDYHTPLNEDDVPEGTGAEGLISTENEGAAPLVTGIPEAWYPRHHIHYAMRVMDVLDDLPKIEGAGRAPFAK